MELALVSPYLPSGRIKKAVLSGDASSEIIASLADYGIEIIKTEKHPVLPNGLAKHADMQMVNVCRGVFVYAPDTPENTLSSLKAIGYELIEGATRLKSRYPFDVAYNCAIVGKNAFCNPRYTDPTVLSMLDKCGIRIFPVKQGYAKCSTCIISEEAIITADSKIHEKALVAGLDSLLIRPQDSIILDGYDYGFIGGATGLISENELAFFGDFITLNDNIIIGEFLNKHGIKPISLAKGNLVDLGGLFPLCASYNGQ
ncbi:MAG TPA: hypothetical protein GXX26_06600 [Clostridiaceae bacterium]|nr:hypothetical protein [Clostridiaceae bacterium]